jgi:hypothetical protein
MSVPPLPNAPYYRPFAPTSTEASWKAAKTAGIRDKWNTELSAALRAAKTAYDKIKFERLAVNLHVNQHGQWAVAADVLVAKTAAQQHYNVVVKPAIKALETAKSKATWAGRNLVVTKQVNTKAKQIALDLGQRLTQLKGIRFDDYDQEKLRLERAFQFTYNGFGAAMTRVLNAAATFVTDVRNTPTADYFNTHVQDAARDVTQQVGNAEKLKKNGLDLGKPDPAALVLPLEDWAQDRGKLPDNANRQAVLRTVRRFETYIEDIDDWWN